jgi:hypothetical protein
MATIRRRRGAEAERSAQQPSIAEQSPTDGSAGGSRVEDYEISWKGINSLDLVIAD